MVPVRWLAVGFTLHLVPTDHGAGAVPLADPYVKFSYRSLWQLLGMGTEWADAFVLDLANMPLAPGDADRAVIVATAPRYLHLSSVASIAAAPGCLPALASP